MQHEGRVQPARIKMGDSGHEYNLTGKYAANYCTPCRQSRRAKLRIERYKTACSSQRAIMSQESDIQNHI